MLNGKKIGAVILAGGKSMRMNSDVPKQYSIIAGRPLIVWPLLAFERSAVDRIILVVAAGDEDYVKDNILSGLNLKKLSAVVPGGEERCDSVYEGMLALDGSGCDIVLIHDGARPLVTEDMIERVICGADEYGACVAAMPEKDTVRIANDEGFAVSTTDRSHLWQMQTPQGFSYPLLKEAFEELNATTMPRNYITDDAMVAQLIPGTRVKLVYGNYENLKVTTPEDLIIAEALMERRLQSQN